MSIQNLHVIEKNSRMHVRPLVLGMAAAMTVAMVAAPNASALCLLSGIEDSAIILDSGKNAPSISSSVVSISSSSAGHNVRFKKGQSVTISYQGQTISETTKNETVPVLLERLGIVPGPLDMISVHVADDQISLQIASDITVYERTTEPAPFQTIRRPNPSMMKGEEKVVQEGVDGVRASVYEVVWSNGQEISRQFVEELDSTAKDKIIEYGTATVPAPVVTENISSPIANVTKNSDGSGTLTLSTGEVLEFSSVKNMKATAYTTGHDGVGTRTATGTHVHRGSVAVDKRYIPLGTRMYIVTSDGSYVYGLGVAEDTGNVGKNLDLYHDTYEQCINFGRRGVTVYFLK